MAINDILSFNNKYRESRRTRTPSAHRLFVLTLGLTQLLGGCDRTLPAAPAAASGNITCNLNHEPCRTPTPWGMMRLNLSPQPLPVLRPISIELNFDHPNATSVTAKLDGVEMDMGPNIAQLVRVDPKTFRAQMIIPICLTGTMKWRLTLQLTDGARQQTVSFSFDAPLAKSADTTAQHPN